MTIASAMSGTVSDTRAMGEPTLTTVDRPTSRSMSVASGSGAEPAVQEPGAGVKAGGACCAIGAATRMTMMNTTMATVVLKP